MSYQVIARKWRPQRFEEVTGQEAITRTLQNAIRLGRLHHAFLFSGPRGCGKTTTARILAKALNCHKGLTAEPCLQCPSCQEIAAGNAIDVLEIDAASNTGVDNVRDVIINTIAINPARDRYKIFIIDEVHMLSLSAFNALLKTLEEPPPHAVFILATTELHKVPQTILSRCQHFEFRTIAAEAIAERLKLIAEAEKITVSDAALLQVAMAGHGSMRDAQSAFDQVISFSGAQIDDDDVRMALGIINQQTLDDFTLAIAARDERRLIKLTAELSATGYDLRQFCRDLMVHFRNLLVLKTAGYERELIPVAESELPRLRPQAEHFSSEDLVRFFHLLTAIEQELKLTTQPRFQLEVGLVKLAQMSRLQSVEEILKRLAALEGRLASGVVSVAPPPAPVREPQATVTKEPPLPAPEKKIVKPVEEDLPPEPPPELDSEPVLEVSPPALPSKSFNSDQQFVAELKAALEARPGKMFLVTSLNNAVSIVSKDDRLIIQFDKANESYNKVKSKESRQTIQETVKTKFDMDLKVEVSLVDSAQSGNQMNSAGESEELLKQAEKNPIVQSVVKTFKGEITDVRRDD